MGTSTETRCDASASLPLGRAKPPSPKRFLSSGIHRQLLEDMTPKTKPFDARPLSCTVTTCDIDFPTVIPGHEDTTASISHADEAIPRSFIIPSALHHAGFASDQPMIHLDESEYKDLLIDSGSIFSQPDLDESTANWGSVMETPNKLPNTCHVTRSGWRLFWVH